MSNVWLKQSKRRARRHAFTMIELVVVVLIVSVLASILIPFIRKTRETDNRVRCSENLRAIGGALQAYAKANDGALPRVVHDVANEPGGYYAYTAPFAANPFAGDGRVSANDVTASLWLLVSGGYVSPAVFVCPSTDDYPDDLTGPDGRTVVGAHERSNFRRARNLSYSFASPFSASTAYKFDVNTPPGDFVILADKNPGRSKGSDVTAVPYNAAPLELARANSHNHGRAGQQALYAGMYVEFQRSPYCAFGGDNIYTARAATPLPETAATDMTPNGVLGRQYGPALKSDSYLVPTAEEDRERGK
jgi:prepilin-type N-terminal cleavage/methylation domain-containing protein